MRVRLGPVAAAMAVLGLLGCGSGAEAPPSSRSSSSSEAATTSGVTGDATAGSGTDATSSAPSTAAPAPSASAAREPSGAEQAAGEAAVDAGARPTTLSIPAVGLRTELSGMGLRGGVVNPPPGEVIWFTGHDRAVPGEVGTAVLAGHVTTGGRPDHFAALEGLSKGDAITVDYPGGSALRFTVTRTEVVDKTELSTRAEVWGEPARGRRLVLITCDDELGFRTDGHRRANFVAVAEVG